VIAGIDLVVIVLTVGNWKLKQCYCFCFSFQLSLRLWPRWNHCLST